MRLNPSELFYVARHSHMRKQAFAGALGTTAAYMTPGLGTALSGRDAFRSFAKGNILGGLGHTALAGLSLIPGGGGIGAAIKGVKGMGKMVGAGKALGAASKMAPTLSKAVGGGLNRATNMGRQAVTAFDKSRLVTGINKLPGVRHIQAAPKTSLAGGLGATVAGDMRQAGREAAVNRTADVFNSLRGSMPTANPLSAMPGNKPLIGSVFGG